MASRLAIEGVQPDLVLVLVVFFGLYAPRQDAYIAGWVLGLATDLMSIERLGLFSITFCAVAVMVNAVRNLVFLKSVATHLIITLAASLLAQIGLLAYRASVGAESVGAVHRVASECALIALYTAICATVVDSLLLRGSRVLGLHTSRYTHHGATRMRAARV